MGRRVRKILLISGIVVVCVVAAPFIVGLIRSKVAADVREVNLSDQDVNNFNIQLSTSDLEFIPTNDGTKKVVFHETDKVFHEDKVEDHTLYVTYKTTKKFWQYLIPDFTKKKVEIYYPSTEFGSLKVESSTGEIEVPKEYSFDSADISATTGQIKYDASVKGNLSINTSTGDISIKDVTAKSLKVKRSTGDVDMKNVTVEEDIELKGTTGKVDLERVLCNKLEIRNSTGDIEFDAIDATTSIDIKTSTGDVEGSLLTGKTFDCQSTTGKISIPDQSIGAPLCKVRTDTGDIKISVK